LLNVLYVHPTSIFDIPAGNPIIHFHSSIFRYWRLEGVDKVLVPAHLNDNHWTMVVATVPARSIQLFDSMNNGFRTDTKRRLMQTVLWVPTSIPFAFIKFHWYSIFLNGKTAFIVKAEYQLNPKNPQNFPCGVGTNPSVTMGARQMRQILSPAVSAWREGWASLSPLSSAACIPHLTPASAALWIIFFV
jgi:hypothetical protein